MGVGPLDEDLDGAYALEEEEQLRCAGVDRLEQATHLGEGGGASG